MELSRLQPPSLPFAPTALLSPQAPHTNPLWSCVALLALCAEPRAQTPSTVSPADRATLEGNTFTHFPLGRKDARMQTLHDDVPGGTLLSGHAYRRDAIGVRGIVQGFASDLQVTVSMAPHAAAQASSAFANNVGPSPVVVLPRTIVAFPATDRPALDPAPTFELTIPYAVPFLVPMSGGTVCVDVEIYGNQTASGPNQNLSIYLDGHLNYADGRAQQPAFRTGDGCPAPGQSTDCHAELDLWRLANGTTQLDVSVRDGVPDTGNGMTRAFLMLGTSIDGSMWPSRPDCTFWSSAEWWYALPGTMSPQGDYDGMLSNLPLLPPGYRLWCQAGSIDLGSVALAFSDALTLVTPPSGPMPIPTVRIANSNDHTAATGTVSDAVPVMAFF